MAGSSGGRRKTPGERRVERADVDDVGIVVEAALRFLEPRARSTSEVRRRLTSAGFRPELVDQTLARLTGLGVLDDAAFARDWVRSRDRAHPRGERALRSELRAKGLADEVIAEVLEERRTPDDDADPEEQAAARLLERKAAFLRRSSDPRQVRQRAYALLVRNGFSSELAWRLAAGVAAIDDPGDAAREPPAPGG